MTTPMTPRSHITILLLFTLLAGALPLSAYAKGADAYPTATGRIGTSLGTSIDTSIHHDRGIGPHLEKMKADFETIRTRQKQSERLSSIRELVKRDAFKSYHNSDSEARARVVAKGDIEEAHQRFLDSKEKEQAALHTFKQQKEEVKELRKNATETCRDHKESDACKNAKVQTAAKAKESLIHAADSALEAIAKVQTKISESEYLTNEEEASLKAKLDVHSKSIQASKEKLLSLSPNATATEVETEAKTLRTKISNSAKELRVISQLLVSFRMGGIIVKSKQLEARLSAVLEKATKQGKNVQAIDAIVDQFHAQLEASATAHEDARAKLLSGDISGGQARMKDSKAALDKAHALIKAIFQSLKAQGLDQDLQAQDIEARVSSELSMTSQASATA